MKPVMSIIIPVYNVDLYLRACLESIKEQTLDDFECILVDDGSTDESGDICDEYANSDTRFKAFHIKNQGVSNARNYGVRMATGDYITFVDSDDYIDKETYFEAIRVIHKDGCDVCCFGIKRVSENQESSIVDFKDLGITKNYIYYDVYMHSVCNKVFKRELIIDNNIAFPQDLIVCEDMLFAFKAIALCSRVSYIDKPYYFYRTNLQSVCQAGLSAEKIDNYKTVAIYLEEFCKRNKIYDGYESFIKYRKMYYAIQFLINPTFYSPSKFRDTRGKGNIWIYTFRPDLFIITICSAIHFDLPARVFIELKKRKNKNNS